MKKRFDDDWLSELAPNGKRREYADSATAGLVLRLGEKGNKQFSVLYRVSGEGPPSKEGMPTKGKMKRMTLGTYPAVTLDQARENAMLAQRQASKGIDPGKLKIEGLKLNQETKFSEMVPTFIKALKREKVQSFKKAEQTFAKHIPDDFGARPVATIERRHITALLDDMVDEGKEGMAREVRKHLTRFFGWCANAGHIKHDPIAGMKRRDLAYNPEESGRELSDAELRAIWAACGRIGSKDFPGYPFGTYVRLTMLYGTRRAEWAHATWQEIDREKGTFSIPASRHKMGRKLLGRPFVLPLGDLASEVLDTIPRQTGPYVFSTRGGQRPISGFTQLKARLDKETGLNEPWTLHDLRRTVRSRLAAGGFSDTIQDAFLGHGKDGAIKQAYDKHTYLPEKIQALTYWEDIVRNVVKT